MLVVCAREFRGVKEGTRAFLLPTQSEGRRPMDAGESRRAERKQRRDRERRRKGAEQSDQAFGGDDVAVRVRETSSTSPRRGRNDHPPRFFPRDRAVR